MFFFLNFICVGNQQAPAVAKSKAGQAKATVAKSNPAVVLGALASVGADVVKGVQVRRTLLLS